MGGGGPGVPNPCVLAAQSPFNIMQGDYAKFAGRPCCPAHRPKSGSHRLICIMSGAPAYRRRRRAAAQG
ncbi:hypothetical protein, partial [Xenorhabdus griffiniae]|uniref:hypothetical protein n=1 Tax=Xenorhabdus griffiniae TaxID=351672 RepID=UPI0030D8F992